MITSLMMIISLAEIAPYLPPEYPCNKAGVIQYLKDDMEREEDYFQALRIVKKLVANRFKGKILIKDKTVEIRPIHISITQPFERMLKFLKGKYGKRHKNTHL